MCECVCVCVCVCVRERERGEREREWRINSQPEGVILKSPFSQRFNKTKIYRRKRQTFNTQSASFSFIRVFTLCSLNFYFIPDNYIEKIDLRYFQYHASLHQQHLITDIYSRWKKVPQQLLSWKPSADNLSFRRTAVAPSCSEEKPYVPHRTWRGWSEWTLVTTNIKIVWQTLQCGNRLFLPSGVCTYTAIILIMPLLPLYSMSFHTTDRQDFSYLTVQQVRFAQWITRFTLDWT